VGKEEKRNAPSTRLHELSGHLPKKQEYEGGRETRGKRGKEPGKEERGKSMHEKLETERN